LILMMFFQRTGFQCSTGALPLTAKDDTSKGLFEVK